MVVNESCKLGIDRHWSKSKIAWKKRSKKLETFELSSNFSTYGCGRPQFKNRLAEIVRDPHSNYELHHKVIQFHA